MYVKGKYISVSVETIIQRLKDKLLESAILRFSDIISGENYVLVSCPFHKDGLENHASCSIFRDTGQCHCFTCGWHGNIYQFISEVLGYENESVGKRFLLRGSETILPAQRVFNLDMSREKKVKNVSEVSEQELDSYRYIHPYMYQRGLTDDLIQQFDVGYDAYTDTITFPVWDLQGRCLFVARRSVTYKQFRYPKGAIKPVYGANFFAAGEYSCAVIVESFFNCFTCWRYGFPAVALLGTGSDGQYEILQKLPVRKYILALDPDFAGERGRLKLHNALQDKKILTEWKIPDGQDVNDLGESILSLHEIF